MAQYKKFSLTSRAERKRRTDKEFCIEAKQRVNVVEDENGDEYRLLVLNELADWFQQPVGQVKNRLAEIMEKHGESTIMQVIGTDEIVTENKKRGRKRGAKSSAKRDGGLTDMILALENGSDSDETSELSVA